MRFRKIRTRKFLPPKDDLQSLLDRYLPKLEDGDILFITSKILAIGQGRCLPIGQAPDKQALVRQEAEEYLPGSRQTIKNGTFVSNAGIDSSNGNGYYVLWPEKIESTLKNIWLELRRKFKIKRLGIIATDTHSLPLRYGTIGTAIGSYGIEPLLDMRGKEDVFGRKLKYTKVNLLDSLAATSVLLMGESGERTPLLVLTGAGFARFTSKPAFGKLRVPRRQDNFAAMLKSFRPQNRPLQVPKNLL